MAEIELIRVTDAEGAAPAIALGRVYMDWMVDQVAEHCGIRLSPEEVERLHADLIAEGPHLLVDPGRVYLGRVDGEPAAIGVLKPVGEGVGELKRIYVEPAHRGHDFGRTIFERLLDDARELGYRQLRLETFPFLTAAVDMYRRHGFVEVAAFEGSEVGDRGLGGFELFMELDLA